MRRKPPSMKSQQWAAEYCILIEIKFPSDQSGGAMQTEAALNGEAALHLSR